MNGDGDSAADCLAVAQRAEHKANGAYDHALDLHEKLGEVYRVIEAIRIQVNDINFKLTNVREKFESVPDLIDTQIERREVLEDANTWRTIKDFGKTTVGSILSKVAMAVTGLALGYLAHKLGVFGK